MSTKSKSKDPTLIRFDWAMKRLLRHKANNTRKACNDNNAVTVCVFYSTNGLCSKINLSNFSINFVVN
jgi:hypothetical protein